MPETPLIVLTVVGSLQRASVSRVVIQHVAKPLQARVERADAIVLGTPDYHGCIGSAMKNFLDHFWREFAGKLFAPIVASHEKGLTVTDQLRTVARQCYAWTLPYAVAFTEEVDVKDGKIVSESLQKRLAMLIR